MDLRAIFFQFSNEEIKKFREFLKNQSKRSDQKNVELFNRLSNPKIKISIIPTLIYGSDNKNAYHALRKRLTDAYITFKSNELMVKEISGEMTVTRLLVVARDLFQKQLYDQGFDLLKKAEQRAYELNNYLLLNEIYHLMIEYVGFSDFQLSDLLEKSEQNLHLLINEEKLNKIYALIKAYYNDDSKAEYKSFEELQKELFDKYSVSKEIRYSYRIVYQLSQMAHSFAIATKDYFSIEKFVLENYNRIKATIPQTSNEVYYSFQLLYIIANIYFRKKNFERSIEILNELENKMSQLKQFEAHFRPLYACLYSLNLNYLGSPSEAKNVLLEITEGKEKYETFAMLDIYLCLVVYEFQQGDFRTAKKRLARFYHTDAWYIKHADVEWVIKKNLIEILIFIELDDIDYVVSRMNYFERKYIPYLEETQKDRVVQFFNFIKLVYIKEKNPQSKDFKDYVENNFNWKMPIREDVFEMSFYAWLKSKMEKTPLYQTTIDLVGLE